MRVPETQTAPVPQYSGDLGGPLVDGPKPAIEPLIDDGSAAIALSSLLALHPKAPLAAVREDGVFTELPASFPLHDHPVLKATSALDLVLPHDRPAVISAWDRVLATQASRCPVHLISDPEHTVLFYAFNAQPAFGVYMVVFVPSDAGDAGPIAGGPDVAPALPKVATTRKDERAFLISVDEATTQILGWSAEEMAGRRSLDFVHPDDHATAIENWMEMLASPGPGRRVRLRHKRRDGAWVWFEITNHNLLDDPKHGYVATGMVDISDEMAVHELLDRLAEAIPLGLFQIDTARQVVYTNDRLHKIIGTVRSNDLDRQLERVIADDRPLLEQALERVLVAGLAADVEVRLRRPRSRAPLHCTISLRPLSDGAGTVTGAIGCLTDVTDSTRMRDELKRRATFDDLTGCYNRPSLMLALEAHIASRAPDVNRAAIFVDLDHFKRVNDAFGHATGDELLTIVAERLRGLVRAGDIVGRLGGDEFLILAPEIGGPAQAMELAERIAGMLRREVDLAGESYPHQASIGVAWSAGDEIPADALVARADAAMYASKREGAGCPKLAAAPAETSTVD